MSTPVRFSISASLSKNCFAEQHGESAADGRLAGAHGADQIDVTLAEHGCVGY